MKKISYLLLVFISVCFGGCNPSETDPYGYIVPTIDGSSTFVLKGYENASEGYNVFKTENIDYPFYIQQKKFVGKAWTFVLAPETSLDRMAQVPSADQWKGTLDIVTGICFWARCQGLTQYDFLKFRVAYVLGNDVGLEYVTAGSEEHNLNKNENANSSFEGKSYVTDYSMPHLNPENYYVEHTVTYNNQEILNYAYEWVDSKKHTAWVAYSFDNVTSLKKVKRTDAWNVDPALPEGMSTEEADYKSDGFDKGHICASDERAYCTEANEQTFYFTNMTPQMSSFNQGYWITVEEIVKKWARSGVYDKLYVTKGGTVDQLLVNFTGTKVAADGKMPQTDSAGLTNHGLACPKYYFTAVLAEKSGDYSAIGLIIEHRDDYGYTNDNPVSSSIIKTHALSIDDLELKTGLDFFCNLPDVIENAVESSFNIDDWTW